VAKKDAVIQLLDEVDELCGIFIGDGSKGEPWIDTTRRIERLDKLRHSARRCFKRVRGGKT
jgi:hypothetical protein